MGEQYVFPADRGWRFFAAPSHIDGEGSVIAFALYENAFGQNSLEVAAFVVNDFFLGNPAMELGAIWNWQNFANNLAAI